MKKNSYTPINCSYYDYLEFFATTGKDVPITYSTLKEQVVSTNSKIKNLATIDGEEFMYLTSGEAIRLDRIIEIDGLKLQGYRA